MPNKIGKPMPVKEQTEADPIKDGEDKETGMPDKKKPIGLDMPDHITRITTK